MRDRIAIEVEGVREIHATDVMGVYATLCGLAGGLDGPDADQMQSGLSAGRDELINCGTCRAIWEHARHYKPKDFE